MYNLIVVTHFQKSDKECKYDYDSVSIEMDGEVLKGYGDGYHDDGVRKAQGFVDAFLVLFGDAEVNVTYEDRNDAEDW